MNVHGLSVKYVAVENTDENKQRWWLAELLKNTWQN